MKEMAEKVLGQMKSDLVETAVHASEIKYRGIIDRQQGIIERLGSELDALRPKSDLAAAAHDDDPGIDPDIAHMAKMHSGGGSSSCGGKEDPKNSGDGSSSGGGKEGSVIWTYDGHGGSWKKTIVEN